MSDSDDKDTPVEGSPQGMEEAILYAKKYLEDVLSFFGLNTDVYATTEDNEVIELHVPSTHLNGFLIGQHGDTMRALQFLVSSALRSNNYEYTRVNVDIADYKKARANQVADQAELWIKKVRDSGEPMELNPMNAADRRIVHKVAGEAGLTTESVGEGYDRHVILKPDAETSSKDVPGDAPEPSEDTPEPVVEEPKKPKKTPKKPAQKKSPKTE